MRDTRPMKTNGIRTYRGNVTRRKRENACDASANSIRKYSGLLTALTEIERDNRVPCSPQCALVLLMTLVLLMKPCQTSAVLLIKAFYTRITHEKESKRLPRQSQPI